MTVKELLEKLSSANPEAVVAIEDADTGWFLNVDQILVNPTEVIVGGVYTDEYYIMTEKK